MPSDETVVSIEDGLPHTCGPMVCANCDAKWICVVRAGVTVVNCPECKTLKGIREGFVFPADVDTYRCDCEVSCALWTIMADGQIMCAHCGEVSDWPEPR